MGGGYISSDRSLVLFALVAAKAEEGARAASRGRGNRRGAGAARAVDLLNARRGRAAAGSAKKKCAEH